MKNCFTYAVGRWWAEGGYLMVRRSLAWELFRVAELPWYSPARLVWLVPHFLHKAYSGRITQYVPTPEQIDRHSHSLLRFWLSLWHFDGIVVEGDGVCGALRSRSART